MISSIPTTVLDNLLNFKQRRATESENRIHRFTGKIKLVCLYEEGISRESDYIHGEFEIVLSSGVKYTLAKKVKWDSVYNRYRSRWVTITGYLDSEQETLLPLSITPCGGVPVEKDVNNISNIFSIKKRKHFSRDEEGLNPYVFPMYA